MNSSTRLYERLGQIPQDPEDPESLEDLIVCAFGAFERYYVCWKNRAGEYRQDGYDLPPELQEWLFPTDGSTRDFATLQVVFGRGDEFFASDKNGKLEYKEPEKKPPPPEEVEEKPVLKRSRTISFFRPLSDTSTKQVAPSAETPPIPRRPSNSSQSASRPPSMSFSSRSMSDASLSSQSGSRPPSLTFSRPTSESSFVSQPSTTTTVPSRPPSDPDVKPIDTTIEPVYQEPPTASPVTAPLRLTRRTRPLSMSFNSGSFPRIPEGRKLLPPEPTPPLPVKDPTHCTCGCHTTPIRRSTYTDASVQTSPLPSPPRTALRIDTTTASYPPFYSNNSSASQEIQTPADLDFYGQPVGGNPVFMGRMLDYFSKPGYQLGDGLMGGYYGYEQTDYQEPIYQEPVYEYRDEFGELAAWEEANGRG